VLGNALARGGVHVATIALSGALATAALLLAMHARRRHSPGEPDDGTIAIPLPLVGLVILALVMVAQLVPLPAFVVRLLSPQAADLFERHLRPIGAWPAARPLSLDPAQTALEFAKSVTWATVAVAASIVATDKHRRDAMLRAIALAGPFVVAAVFAGKLSGYAPLLEPRFPFVNPNHLAGFLQLAAWPALGFGLRERGPARVSWLAAFAFTGSGIFLSLSRAGIGAFVIGTGLFAALYVRSRRVESPTAAPRPTFLETFRSGPKAVLRAAWANASMVSTVAVSAVLALAAFLALDRIVSEMRTVSEASTTAVKLGLWPAALTVMRAFPITGIGRGAFASVFPAFNSEPIQATFTHVENEWLQLPVDLGVIPGVAGILLFAWAWFATARRRELSRPVMGALAGVGALVAQNVFDFGLEIAGVAIPFALATGMFARKARSHRFPRWAVRGVAVSLAALAGVGIAVYQAHDPEGDALRVSEAGTADEALALAIDSIRWHPADWVPPAAVATKLAGELRCAEAAPWLERAAERNPSAPETHLGAARCYAIGGKTALAKREYRLAFMYGDRTVLTEASRVFPAPGALLEIAPETPEGLFAAGLLLADRPAEAREAWRRAWESFRIPGALGRLADATLALGDAEGALALARELQHTDASRPAGYLVASRALDELGDEDAAQRELELGAARAPGDVEVLVTLGVRYLRHGRFSQARFTFEHIVPRERSEEATKHVFMARALEGQGRYAEALREAQDAIDVGPEDLRALETFSRLAALVGRYDEAIDALERAARSPRSEPGAYDARLDALREERIAGRSRVVGGTSQTSP
jgi:tetratricopeptide (TPR) repeat protein